MPITIIQPRPTPQFVHRDGGASSDSDSDAGGVDLEGDVSMSMGRPSKRAKYGDDIVTPGEVITDDTQYMRYVKPPPPTSLIFKSSFPLIQIPEVMEPTSFPTPSAPPSPPP